MSIKDIIKSFENSENTVLYINDKYLDIKLTIPRKNIAKISYAVTEKDEAYLDFIAPSTMVTCFGIFVKGSMIKNWCVDERCTLRIKEVKENMKC